MSSQLGGRLFFCLFFFFFGKAREHGRRASIHLFLALPRCSTGWDHPSCLEVKRDFLGGQGWAEAKDKRRDERVRPLKSPPWDWTLSLRPQRKSSSEPWEPETRLSTLFNTKFSGRRRCREMNQSRECVTPPMISTWRAVCTRSSRARSWAPRPCERHHGWLAGRAKGLLESWRYWWF